MIPQYLTQSMINCFFLCAERYRRRFPNKEIRPPGIAARIGTGVHAGAEANHRAKMLTGRDEPLDVVTDAARDGYRTAVSDGVLFAEEEKGTEVMQIDQGLQTVIDLTTLYYTELAPLIQPVLVEETLWVDTCTEEFTIPLRGTIDVLTTDSWLPDLKTAGKRWSQAKADTAIQPTIYRELVRHATGTYPTKLSFEVLVKKATPEWQSVETTRTAEDFDLVLRRIQVMLRMIRAGTFPPPPPDSWQCHPKWCGYYDTCPYQKGTTIVF